MLDLRSVDFNLHRSKKDERMIAVSGIEVRMNGKGASSLSVGDGEVRGKGSGVGPAIAAAREMQGLSRTQLAEALRISKEELGLIEKGRKDASPETLLALAQGLNMQVEITIDVVPDYTMSIRFKKMRGEKK